VAIIRRRGIKNLTEIPGALVLRGGNSIKLNCILEDELKCLRAPFLQRWRGD
jgi:hypothetical protein